jgi:hypothetical protein
MKRESDEPTLGEAWEMLGPRLGLNVEPSGNDRVRATGTVCGRTVTVEISGRGSDQGLRGFLREFRAPQRQGRARESWQTQVRVSCANSEGLVGWIESVVDVTDPAWNPRNYDPRAGRVVRSDPVHLRERVVTPSVYERLMDIVPDVRFELDADSLCLDDISSTSRGGGFVAASPIHGPRGPVVPWPERALVGPPWWIELMCDLADAVEGKATRASPDTSGDPAAT